MIKREIYMSRIRPFIGNELIKVLTCLLYTSFLGIALGTFSKYLDFRQTELPGVLMAINGVLDIGRCV